MKKTLDVTYSKDGDEILTFHPTARMQLFAIKKSENPGMGDVEVAKLAGLDPQLPRRWAARFGTHYLEWLEDYVDSCTNGNDAAVIERVGFLQATQAGNYQYWRDYARKHGVIKDEVKEQNITINTDFSAILIGDPDEARRRILQEIRGVVIPTGSRVVTDSRTGEQASPGSGTSIVQEGSVEVLNALDTDRERPGSGEPFPAVSKQDTPPGPDRVLAKRKVPARTKK